MAGALVAVSLSACGGKSVSTETAKDSTETAVQTPEKGFEVATLPSDDAIRANTPQAKPVVMDFNASWCVPCRKFTPVFDQAAEKYGDKVTFYSVDIDSFPQTAQAFGIQAVPTVVILDKEGKVAGFYKGLDEIGTNEKFNAIVEKL